MRWIPLLLTLALLSPVLAQDAERPALIITGFGAPDLPPGRMYATVSYAPDVAPGADVVLTITADPPIPRGYQPAYTSDDWRAPEGSTICAVRSQGRLICDALSAPAAVLLNLPLATRAITVSASTAQTHADGVATFGGPLPQSVPRVVLPLVSR